MSSSQLAPISRRSVVDEAHRVLQARILHGVWVPGTKLPTEQALTAALGVSRSTLREALNRLASQGLVEIPHGGTKRVREWRDHGGLELLEALVVDPAGEVNPAVVQAITEMRGAIAPDVARLAATRAEPARVAELVRRAEALDSRAPLEELLRDTLAWWTELVHASGNLAYRLAYNSLCATYREGRPILRELIADELRAVSLYRSVSAAVAAGDPSRAESSCRELIALGNDALLWAIAAHTGEA